jgi:peptidoglycan/LPS O-acetylase OafA/YrhL
MRHVHGIRTETHVHAVTQRIEALTGLRFIAAFCILIHHTTEWTSPFTNSKALLVVGDSIGIFGMPLFFVLSGFVIHYNYGRLFDNASLVQAARTFAIARFSRIYPLFFCCFLYGGLSDFTLSWVRDGLYADFALFLVSFLTLSQSWFYATVVDGRPLFQNAFGLSWSISTEMFFYICYVPLVFLILTLRRPGNVVAAAAAFSAATLIGLVIFAAPHFDGGQFSSWLFYYSPYCRIFEFLLGCMVAQYYIKSAPDIPTNKEHNTLTGALCVASVVAMFMVVIYTLKNFGLVDNSLSTTVSFLLLNFGLAPFIAIGIIHLTRFESRMACLLSVPPLVWLGEISYSVYAVHTWTLRPLIRAAVPLSGVTLIDAVLRVSVGIAATIIVAAATWRFIEVPARDYLRRRFARATAPHCGARPIDKDLAAGPLI